MKKGLMQSTLAAIIIILLSAAVLIAFYWQFSDLFTSNVDRGTCRASVELRSEETIGKLAQSKIPLRCKTNYYCITMGGTCPEGYTKIRVNNEDDVKREIAFYMYDCWWMLGEGNLNFFSRAITKESHCVFCSQIAFDDKIQAKYPQITGMGNYLRDNIVPRTNTSYWAYFTKVKTLDDATMISEGDSFPTDERYVIIYSLVEKSFLARALLSGSIAGTAMMAGLPKLGGVIGTIVIPVPVVGTAIGYSVGAGASIALGITVGKKINEALEKSPYDYYVSFNLVNFNANVINEFGCEKIESIP